MRCVRSSTVTFAARKPGLCFEPGRTHAGAVRVADIGIDVSGPDEPMLALVERADVHDWLVPRAPDANKWTLGAARRRRVRWHDRRTDVRQPRGDARRRGHRLVRGAGRRGRGRDAAGTEVIARAFPADVAGAWCAVPDDVLDALPRFRAVAIGPGLADGARDAGRGARARRRASTRRSCSTPTGSTPSPVTPVRCATRGGPTVLTPHEGEYARLLGEPVGEDRVDAARRLAEATGAVALLKGPGTVVAAPDGRAVIEPVGDAALATAGSGDVLTGIIAGLLARGLEPFAAAAAGAFLHGRAARRAGHTGLVAGDLVAALPARPRRSRRRGGGPLIRRGRQQRSERPRRRYPALQRATQ